MRDEMRHDLTYQREEGTLDERRDETRRGDTNRGEALPDVFEEEDAERLAR